jgi:hypothetical protein
MHTRRDRHKKWREKVREVTGKVEGRGGTGRKEGEKTERRLR